MAVAQESELRWLSPSDAPLEVNGLPWFAENKGELIRFPLRLKDTLPKAVWSLANSPSGGRIRFRTDSNKIALRLEYPSPPNMANMHAFGQTGVDLYLDGNYWATMVADKDSKPGVVAEKVVFQLEKAARAEREVTLYLPLYKPVKVAGIGVEKAAKLSRAKSFAMAKPVVYYGTSITQGGCASRSGMSYQAILERMLNADFVNLGFSGNGKGEAEVARAVAEIDASVFVLDFALNNATAESVKQVYDPFITILREKHPDTPILAMSPIYMPRERLVSENREAELMRRHIREVVSRRVAGGDAKLQLVEGTDLLGPDTLDAFVDGVHPNDLGFQWMAKALAPRLAKVLGLPVPPLR
jgi:lysophospholipase L1-like esterase